MYYEGMNYLDDNNFMDYKGRISIGDEERLSHIARMNNMFTFNMNSIIIHVIREYYKEHNDAEEIIRAIQKIAERDSRVVMNFKWNFVHHVETECSAFWAQIALNEKGEVMYCCQKPYQIVGHIMDEDILLKKERMLTDISMCDVPCRLTAPNLEVRNFLSQKDIAFI